MTGGSPTQTGSDRTVKKFFGMAQALEAATRAMGHEVDIRPPRVDDPDVGGYDLIIAGYSCLASMSGRYSNFIVKWIGDAAHGELATPMVVYMDDWHMKQSVSTMGSILSDPNRIYAKSEALGRPTNEWLKADPANHAAVLRGVQAMADGNWPRFILHRFPWGDEGVLTSLGKIAEGQAWSMDPSGFMPNYPVEPPDDRLEEWTCPRLQTFYDPWLDELAERLQWPITRFGNQRMQEQVIPESKIPQVICEYAATLIPAGTHSGSGLWRSRYLMAAWTKTPMFVAAEEVMATLDGSFTVQPWDIERMSPAEREKLAVEQGRVVLGKVWNRQQMVDRLQWLFSDTLGRDLGLAPRVADTDPIPQRPTAPVHPLLQPVTQTAGPRVARTAGGRQKPCCGAMVLEEGQQKVRDHHPECPMVKPKPCSCLTWARTPEMGEDVVGTNGQSHHPNCPKLKFPALGQKATREPRAPRVQRSRACCSIEGLDPSEQVRGHNPDCPRLQPRANSLPEAIPAHLRPKPGDEGYSVLDPVSGMHHRPGTLDYYVIKEVKAYLQMGITKEDRVLDVGGHIGGFTTLAARCGAEVWAYEPDPENFALLELNTGAFNGRVHLTAAALTSGNEDRVALYLNLGANTGTHTLIPTRGRDIVEVQALDFQRVMAEVEPTVLKVDIEGGEYSLDFAIPPSVRMLCMELHRMKPGHREAADVLNARVLEQGFVPIKEPKLSGGAWAVLGIWRRDA
jgi:FkbM family methyltransferase